MNDPKYNTNPASPDKGDDQPSREGSSPQPGLEIPPGSARPEIPPKPSRDLPQPDRERAEKKG